MKTYEHIEHVRQFALKESLEHWRRMRRSPILCMKWGETPEGKYCALCRFFADDECEQCLVAQRTGEANCRKTPWLEAHFAFQQLAGNYQSLQIDREAAKAGFLRALSNWRTASDAQIEFLESL